MSSNPTPDSSLATRLTDAVLRGDSESARSLLAAGADADTRDKDIPLLTLAVLRDDVPTAATLLEAGADVQAEALASRRTVGFMLSVQMHHLGAHYRALGLELDDRELYHALPIRFATSAAMVRLLKQHGARLGGERNARLAQGDAPTELVAALLEGEGGVKHNSSNIKGLVRPVLMAAAEGQAARLELMLRAGGKANQMLENFRTPLHYAATPEVVRVLLAHGACIDAPDSNYDTPLGTACSPAVAEELRAHGAKRTHLRPVYLPELHEAVRLNEFAQVRRLLDAGADVNGRSEYGTTPLFHATGMRMTRLLLDHGADARAVDAFGNSALPFIRSKAQLPLLLAAMELPTTTAQPPLPRFFPRYEALRYQGEHLPCGIIPRGEKPPHFNDRPATPLCTELLEKAGRHPAR